MTNRAVAKYRTGDSVTRPWFFHGLKGILLIPSRKGNLEGTKVVSLESHGNDQGTRRLIRACLLLLSLHLQGFQGE